MTHLRVIVSAHALHVVTRMIHDVRFVFIMVWHIHATTIHVRHLHLHVHFVVHMHHLALAWLPASYRRIYHTKYHRDVADHQKRYKQAKMQLQLRSVS